MKHLHIEHISSPCESASLVQHTGLIYARCRCIHCYIDFDHYDNDCDDDDNDDNDYNDQVHAD